MASETDAGRYLIHKAGRGWYRPDAQGYTLDPRQAGRYSFDEAVSHSHPNGPFGPRDGIVVKNENEVYGACPDTPVVTRPAPEYAGLVERLAGMEPLDTAPRDRTHILAKTLPRDDQWSNYGGRWFVVWHIDKVSGWSLFPGMGVGDGWFEGWVRLPLAAATALTDLTARNKALEAEVEQLREAAAAVLHDWHSDTGFVESVRLATGRPWPWYHGEKSVADLRAALGDRP